MRLPIGASIVIAGKVVQPAKDGTFKAPISREVYVVSSSNYATISGKSGLYSQSEVTKAIAKGSCKNPVSIS
jgi:hypothetical protein